MTGGGEKKNTPLRDVRELLAEWNTPTERRVWERARAIAEQAQNPKQAAAAQEALDELADVSALDALRANAELVDLLTGRRWIEMQAAREAGATWAQIGEALGMSKQGAYDWYVRKIEQQEKYLPDLHDAEAARAVLDDQTSRTSARTAEEGS